MQGYIKCSMGFCDNQILCTNLNNPKRRKKLCNNCENLTKTVKRKHINAPEGDFIKYVSYMIARAKSRNKYEVTITVDDIYKIWPKNNCCPIMGTLFVSGEPRKNSPSLDRIDPTKGYVPGNIQIICDLANKMKQNATQEELERFCKYYG